MLLKIRFTRLFLKLTYFKAPVTQPPVLVEWLRGSGGWEAGRGGRAQHPHDCSLVFGRCVGLVLQKIEICQDFRTFKSVIWDISFALNTVLLIALIILSAFDLFL